MPTTSEAAPAREVSRVLKAGSVRVSRSSVASGGDAHQERERQAAADRRHELDEAYRKGLEAGRAAAEAEGPGALPRVADAIAAGASEAARAGATRHAAGAATIIEVASELARWILGRELTDDTATSLARIEQAMGELSPSVETEIRVAPCVAAAITGQAGLGGATVVADGTLAPGEALVTAGRAEADLRFDTAFRRAAEALDVAPVSAKKRRAARG